jgi:hypothetical protein
MFLQKTNAVLLAAALAWGSASAQAEVLTLEDVPANNYTMSSGQSFTSSAYTFEVAENSFAQMVWYPSTVINLFGTVNMRSAASALFSVASIDLTTLNGNYPVNFTLTGTHADGSTVSQTYYSDTYNWTTVALTGFNSLSSFSITNPPDANGGTYASLVDNIVVHASAISAVPEPGSLAMFGFGAAVIGFTARRRKAV